MRYEIGAAARSAVIDDKGIHITEKKESRFVPFDKIVAVSVRKPGILAAGHIFFKQLQMGTILLRAVTLFHLREKKTMSLLVG